MRRTLSVATGIVASGENGSHRFPFVPHIGVREVAKVTGNLKQKELTMPNVGHRLSPLLPVT